jgi:endonuclease III
LKHPDALNLVRALALNRLFTSLDPENTYHRIIIRFLMTIQFCDTQYKILIAKMLSKLSNDKTSFETIVRLLEPYKANIYYSHEKIIKQLIERYKSIYGKKTN